MWAERYRHLAERGILLHYARSPETSGATGVRDPALADLGDSRRLGRVGLGLPAPGRRTWRPYQQVGEQLWREGWSGLVAPSAARPGGRVLCLFVDDPGAIPVQAVRPPTRRLRAACSADGHADLTYAR